MNDTPATRAERIVEELQLFPDDEERLFEVIRRGKISDGLPDEAKTEERLVPGCVSNLYLVNDLVDGRCDFRTDADAFITKGVAAIVCYVYSGATPQEVTGLTTDFVERAGIKNLLSPNRANGLSQLLSRIQKFAGAVQQT